MENFTRLAGAQLIGFAHAKQGYDIESLVRSMGLQPEEWEELKEEDIGLTDAQKKEIEKCLKDG